MAGRATQRALREEDVRALVTSSAASPALPTLLLTSDDPEWRALAYVLRVRAGGFCIIAPMRPKFRMLLLRWLPKTSRLWLWLPRARWTWKHLDADIWEKRLPPWRVSAGADLRVSGAQAEFDYLEVWWYHLPWMGSVVGLWLLLLWPLSITGWRQPTTTTLFRNKSRPAHLQQTS